MTDENASAEAGNAESVNAEAVQTTTSTEAAPVVQPPAQTAADWKTMLPEDVRNDPSIASFTSLEALAKSHINTKRMIGADKIAIPKEGDTEGWDAVYAKLGRPEKPEDYGFKEPEKVPDGLKYDPELDKRVAAIAHKRGLNRAQAAGVREDLMALVAEGATQNIEANRARELAEKKEIDDTEAALKAEWGAAYEQRGKAVWRFAEENFSPETFALLEKTGLANKPAFIKDIYRLGVSMQGEKKLIGDADAVPSPGDLDSQIARFTAENKEALMDQLHPAHKAAVAERARLFEKRFNA